MDAREDMHSVLVHKLLRLRSHVLVSGGVRPREAGDAPFLGVFMPVWTGLQATWSSGRGLEQDEL